MTLFGWRAWEARTMAALARTPSPIDLEGLVQAARSGDPAAWSELCRRFYRTIQRRARCLTTSDASADDLAQEVFARAQIKISSFDGRATFSSWLHMIVLNAVRNHWRSQRTIAKVRLSLSVVQGGYRAADLDEIHHQLEESRAIWAVLNEMPAHLREAFVLRDIEGLSPSEAAAKLGISRGNVCVRAARARQRIRRELIEVAHSGSSIIDES